MDPEDLPSSSDEDDEDYCPTNDKSEISESESDYDSEGGKIKKSDNPETAKKGKKRKKTSTKRNSKSARLQVHESEEKFEEVEQQEQDVDDKSRVDALWADFLGGSNDDSYSSSKKENTSIPTNSSESSLPEKKISKEPEKVQQETVKITKIFDFVGEKVEVVQEVKPEEIKVPNESKNPSTSAMGSLFGATKKTTGGVGSILEQLNKKNKISTLEKTKLDWESFKNKEGISEELQTHNKGRDG